MHQQTEAKTKPALELRYGTVKCTVWPNQTKAGLIHNVKFSRIYKNGERWSESQQFGKNDLLLIARLAEKAHDWIFNEIQDGKGSVKD